MSKLALIDGDVIRYQIGFATQSKSYFVYGRPFATFVEASEYADKEGIPQETVKMIIRGELIQSVRHTVDKFIDNIMKAAKCSDYKIFLTGDNNYRIALATIRPYKGQRKSPKPVHFGAISEHLIGYHNAIMIEDSEADDALGYSQTEDTVICTIDKDLDGIAGLHYNWNKDKLYDVTQFEADYFFYHQLLTGDAVDNIEGCPNIGQKKADEILKGVTTPLEMFRRCQITYVNTHQKFADKFKLSCAVDSEAIFKGAMKDLTENAHLLWIQRVEDVRWQEPTGGSDG